MIGFSQIQKVLKDVFESATGVKFVWNNEPRSLLAKPFGVLSLGNSASVGRDNFSYDFEDKTLQVYGSRELTINIQIFARDAKGQKSSRELIERARLSLANPIHKESLRKAGLVFLENHSVVDLEFSYDQRHENRSSFDVVFSMCLHELQAIKDINYFDKVNISENIKNESR